MAHIDKADLRAGNFVHNNGRVLRTINILRPSIISWSRWNGCFGDGISEDEFLDAVNFLTDEGYIKLRLISTKEEVPDIADNDYRILEAKLTAKGIRLLAGGIEDNMIEV